MHWGVKQREKFKYFSTEVYSLGNRMSGEVFK